MLMLVLVIAMMMNVKIIIPARDPKQCKNEMQRIQCDHSMCEHPMCEHAMKPRLCVSSRCEHDACHKNTTTPPQKHHHTTTKTPPHHHKNTTMCDRSMCDHSM